MSEPETNEAPTPWSEWRLTVNRLVEAISKTQRLFGSPTPKPGSQEVMKCLASIRTSLRACTKAAEAVGTASTRQDASRQLSRLSEDAIALAEKILASEVTQGSTDAQDAYTWLSRGMVVVMGLENRAGSSSIERDLKEYAETCKTKGIADDSQVDPSKSLGRILTPTERKIWTALAGQAFKGKQLAKQVIESPRSIDRHVKDLMKANLIANCPAIGGYYRPDSPPK